MEGFLSPTPHHERASHLIFTMFTGERLLAQYVLQYNLDRRYGDEERRYSLLMQKVTEGYRPNQPGSSLGKRMARTTRRAASPMRPSGCHPAGC